MMFLTNRLRPLAVRVALAVLAGGLVALPAHARCLSGGEARQAVQAGQAQPLGAIAGGIGGRIVRAELCERGGRLVYELSVLAGDQVRRMRIDARSGQPLR